MFTNKLQKLSYDIYNLLIILENYCQCHSDVEEIECILSEIEILLNKYDKLNQLINS